MRVLLIFPPGNIYPEEDAPQVFSLGIGYLAAVLVEKGYEVKVLDCMIHDVKLEKRGDGLCHVGLSLKKTLILLYM